MLRWLLLPLALILLLTASSSWRDQVSARADVLVIDEPITEETAIRWMVQAQPGMTVMLASPGGSTMQAWQLGMVLHRLGVTTVVPLGEWCSSACTDLFVAGDTRIVSGHLLFHLPHSLSDYTLLDNAALTEFVTYMRYYYEAVGMDEVDISLRFMREGGDLWFRLVGPTEARSVGLSNN